VIWAVLRLVIAVGLTVFLVLNGALVQIFLERKIQAVMQDRLGPYHTGPYGLLQTFADAIKLIGKEDIRAKLTDAPFFLAAPAIVFSPMVASFVVLPFSSDFVGANLNVGLLYLTTLGSMTVLGIVIAGWASNNKYSLMGGLRSAAQMVSYEVPFGLSIVGVLMLCGSFDLVQIVRYQETNAWNFLPQIVACFIFLVAMNAENNRTPFDLPEAESELVAGYHTEYSAMKFAFFMLAEYSAMLVNCCLMVLLFFGGWTLAMFGYGLTSSALRHWGMLGGLIGTAIFFVKVMAFMMVYIWFRATFPRFRFDQLMDLGWKWMIPLALGNIFVTAIFILAGQERLMYWIGVIALGAVVFYMKPKRVHASRVSAV